MNAKHEVLTWRDVELPVPMPDVERYVRFYFADNTSSDYAFVNGRPDDATIWEFARALGIRRWREAIRADTTTNGPEAFYWRERWKAADAA